MYDMLILRMHLELSPEQEKLHLGLIVFSSSIILLLFGNWYGTCLSSEEESQHYKHILFEAIYICHGLTR